MRKTFDLRLYAVTDRTWCKERPLEEVVREAIEAGVTLVQLREKNASTEERIAIGKALKAVTDAFGVPLIVNDDVEAALAIGAAGVHLGQGDMDAKEARQILGEDAIIGVTAKTVEQAKAAELAGADYLGSGAVFGSATKMDAIPMSRETLRAITQEVKIPVVAIGGINRENLSQLEGTGIAGAAVVSGIFAMPDISGAVRDLRRTIDAITDGQWVQFHTRKTALTIAGSDSSGGAGIQADLKTMTALGVYGMSAITALTAQNTCGVSGIFSVPKEFVGEQLDCVFEDIFPDAVKIGMVSERENIRMIARKLRQYEARNVVLDPVMVATSGSRLLAEDAMEMLAEELLPLATVITPNIPEARILAGMEISNEQEMEVAARRISERFGGAVLVKGGHQVADANDVLWANGGAHWFYGKRVHNPNTHGTGCTLSSAIACFLARGCSVEESIQEAKTYLTAALRSGLDLGHGSGPLDHCWKWA